MILECRRRLRGRVYEETRKAVIYTLYICNWCGSGFGASFVQDAGRYTKQMKITNYTEQVQIAIYIKDQHTTIFNGPTACGKSHVVLVLIEKEFNKYFDCIIIYCSML